MSGTWRIESILDHISLVSDEAQQEGESKETEASRLLPGDEIVAIDERRANDLSPQDFAKLIMGPEGTCVALTLCRPDASAAPSAQDTSSFSYVSVVARRSRRTTPFLQPLSASAEGLKAVFRLLGGGGIDESRSGGSGSRQGSPVRHGSPVRRENSSGSGSGGGDGSGRSTMVFF